MQTKATNASIHQHSHQGQKPTVPEYTKSSSGPNKEMWWLDNTCTSGHRTSFKYFWWWTLAPETCRVTLQKHNLHSDASSWCFIWLIFCFVYRPGPYSAVNTLLGYKSLSVKLYWTNEKSLFSPPRFTQSAWIHCVDRTQDLGILIMMICNVSNRICRLIQRNL